MTKTKRAEAMERLRKERKERGLVEFRCWCSHETRKRLRELATELERGG